MVECEARAIEVAGQTVTEQSTNPSTLFLKLILITEQFTDPRLYS